MLLLVLLRAGAGDHNPSHICIHVSSEVEGVLGVNQIANVTTINAHCVVMSKRRAALGPVITHPSEAVQ